MWHAAMRQAGFNVILFVSLVALLGGVSAVTAALGLLGTGADMEKLKQVIDKWPVWSSLLWVMVVVGFFLQLLSEWAGAALHHRPMRPAAAIGATGLAMLLVAAAYGAFRAAIYGGHWLSHGPDVWLWIGFPVVTPFVFIVLAWRLPIELERYERWTGLDLAEA